ncbi:hypothetical protein HL033_00365 [Neoehrlichia mikurensis]|uniref:hypothetical protein n=1 Tax=Neoehrlichia mikurensis TaxID=89586 RepID=UPI001C46679A|nr:hypothetical protein [Neoehrlichia mikurensis]QXK92030.1 hypothetical protein IAH97_00365 [Neoehrlichia mikurensis]QXK93723.1 hypothetical protein HL033_00365 [Neoehrlichia mikurensis]
MVQFLLINIQTSNEYFQKGDFSKTLALPFPPPNLSNQNLDIISHEKFTRYFAISYSKEKTTKYSTEKASENIYGNIESCFGSYFNWKCKLAGKNITIRYHGTIYVSNPDDVKILQDKQSLIYSIKTCNKYDAHIENTNYEYQIEYNKHNFTECNNHSTLAEQNHQYNGYNDTYDDATECNNHSTLAEQKETPSSKCSIKDVFFCCFSKSTCIK